MAALLRAKGIFSLPNFLSEIPEGALLEALNVVIDRDGIIEPRRGFRQWKAFGDISSRAKQLLSYRDKTLVHYGTKLGYETTGNFVPFQDSTGLVDASVIETETGRRIRGVEANGNFYVTTSTGIKRVSSLTDQFLSASKENQLVDAGVAQALDPVVLADYSSSGWMVGLSRVAYRVLIGLTDNNDNLLVGAPSSRVVVTNSASQSCNTKLKIFLPSGLTTDNFIQIYRSNNPFASSIELLDTTVQPDDEVLQIGEVVLTSEDIARGYVDFSDTVPAELQEVGTPLYNNQNTGDGALQTNFAPPFAKDIALYKNAVFFANTKTRHSLDINLLSVEGIEDISISAASLTGTTLSLTTSVNHGLSNGEELFVLVPNTYVPHTYSSAAIATDALTNSTLKDNSIVTSTAAINGLAINTFYRVKRLSTTTIQLLDEKYNVVDITGTASGTLNEQASVCGVFSCQNVGSNTLDITVATGTVALSSLEKDAKLFPAHLTIAKTSSVNKYFFGGNQGVFNLLVNDSVNTIGTALEDKYFRLNSYDRLRPYTFYLSLNEAAPPLDSVTYPETASTIPANVVLENRALEFVVSLNPSGTADNFNPATGVFTKASHGLTNSSTISLNDTFSGAFDTSTLYFVNKLDDNTFTLAYTYGGPAITGTILPLWKQFDNNTDVNTGTDIITVTSHGFGIGVSTPCKLSTTGTFPTVTGSSLDSITTYYAKGITSNTIELYRTADLTGSKVDITAVGSGTTTIIVESLFELSRKSNKVDVAQAISNALDIYGDWNTSTTHKFTISTSALTGSTPPPYTNFNIPSHGLSDGDRVIIEANGTGPTIAFPVLDKMPLDGYYIKLVDTNNFEVYTDAAFTNLVTFSSQGIGSLVLKTNRVTCQNITSGEFGYNSSIALASQVNPDIKAGDSTFSVDILTYGYGEKYSKDTAEFLVKRSRFPLVADRIDETARSLIKLVNINSSLEVVTATYSSGLQDFTPRITFSSKSIDDTPIYFGFRDEQVSGLDAGNDDFEPTLPQVLSASGSSGTTVTYTTSIAHGLVAGDTVVIYSSNSPGVYTVASAPTTLTFTIVYSSSQAADSFVLFFKGEVLTTAETNPNRLYFSKLQQPDAVPLTNYIDIGPKNKAIQRILPLKDSLIVIKEEGLYRVSGIVPDIIDTGFDFSNLVQAPDTAVVLNNQVFVFTTQGVATVTENGATVASRFIENKLIPLTLYNNFKFASFGVSYESDRAYLLFVPTTSTDTVATQCWRYNTFTQAWTRWNKPAACANVNIKTNKLYWGNDDINEIEEERKSFDRLDFADRQYNSEIPPGGYDIAASTLTLPSVANVTVGDALVQTQYVSLAEIKNWAYKISLDTAIPSGSVSFYQNFTPISGSDIKTNIQAIVDQVNLDVGTSFVAPTASSFQDIQTEFNTLMSQMNASAALNITTYNNSTGTKEYETSILSVNNLTSVVSIDDLPPFIEGDLMHYKRIESDVIYAPISLGDPSVMKQVRETTTLFANLNFKSASMGYATDLDAAYDYQTFSMQGSGAFGNFNFGQAVFGGTGPSYPFRTYMPREKQRGRYWNLRFKHSFARFTYSLLGISVVPSSTTDRAYR